VEKFFLYLHFSNLVGSSHSHPKRLTFAAKMRHCKMTRLNNTFLFFLSTFLYLLAGMADPLISQTLAINEIQASNATTIADEDGDFEDWVELYNFGSEPVALDGFGLSDNYDDPFKWVFPATTIYPGQYLLVWASGKNRINPAELHSNFSISASGEEIILTHPGGTMLDVLVPSPVPTDISYGRYPNGSGEWRYFTNPTPGQANQGPGYGFLLDPVEYSVAGGAFQEEFHLNLSHSAESAQIFYTLDGSVPDESSNLFTDPILIRNRQGDPNIISLIPTNNNPDPGPPYFEGWQPPLGEVFKVNVVRARALQPDALPGPVITHTYLVHPEGNQRFSLPWSSLTTDNENLFDDDIGIYVHGNHHNFFQDGPEWERPANLSFFEKDGTLQFNEDIGIRLHGNTTRSRPRKSLRINARNEYGNSWINYQLFPEKPVNQYKRFILRNSGNDWDMSVFRDAFIQYLAKNLNVETQYYRPAILFINGEYWGIHNVRDRYNQHHFLAHYGLEEHEFTTLENNSVFKFGNEAGRNHYVNMRNFISNNNMALDQHYQAVQTMMDVESFTDFQLAHIFAMNTDWPGNNSLYWRFIRNEYMPGAGVRDGRWRWMMLDTDFGFWLNFFYVPGVEQGPAHNTLALATAPNGPNWPNPPWSTLMLRRLLQNESYRHHFINRFCDLMNTTLKAENVIHVMDSIRDMLQPEMQEHINRWRRPVSMSSWQQEVQRMKTFTQQRQGYVRSHINSQFNLSGTVNVSLGVNQAGTGTIRINTIEPEFDESWEGIYFRNIPISLQAIPAPGYRFVEWTGSLAGQAEKIVITPTGNIQITAHFEESDDFQGDEMNPPAYRLANGAYSFSFWDANEPEGSFPPHMIFQQSNNNDPALADEMTHPYHIPPGEYHGDDQGSIGFPYRLTRRTRLNGLFENGISFINTGRSRDLGAAVLAIDTRGLEDITVSWTGGTVQANSRVYAIRMQYRTGHEGNFADLTDSLGHFVEYHRNEQTGHEQDFGPIYLPAELNHQPYVQLSWKYYFTGQQLDPDSGQRDELRLDNINVSFDALNIIEINTKSNHPLILEPNYPNPFSETTLIRFHLVESGYVNIAVYNHAGKKVAMLNDSWLATGKHEMIFDGSILPPGLFFLQILQNQNRAVRKMMIAR
jgi:uncharacterized repeat protein (TIGR02543 family)